MGWFGRGRGGGASWDGPSEGDRSGSGDVLPLDPALPMFDTGVAAARFAALAREVFAEHGLECTYQDGFLRGTDGRSYGLVLDIGGYYKNVVTLAPSLHMSVKEIDLALRLLDQLLHRVAAG